MALRVTQLGFEVWSQNQANIRVTQIGFGVWASTKSNIRVTQIGIGLWRTTADSPSYLTGQADGLARAYAINSNSMLVTGNADGFGTAREAPSPAGAPILPLMGV